MPRAEGARKILIVDDETAIADTLALIFITQNYEVRVAYSAEAAIDVFSQWCPDLAILDVVLPQMNGIDLAALLQENYPACKTLLFSGNTNTSQLLEEAARRGRTFEVLAKPVHPELILEKVSGLLSSPLSKLD